MSFRADRRGFIFSLDAALAMLVLLIMLAGVARVAGPELIYGQHGYLRLERYGNDALEILELNGAMNSIRRLLANGERTQAENLAEIELRKILPEEVQFRLRIGAENNPRLDNVYPSAGKHVEWGAAFTNAEEIAGAARVLTFLYQIDQNNPYQSGGWHDIKDKDWQAQTFVAGRTGALTNVALYLMKEESPGVLTIEIRNCAGADNPPGSTILASMTTSDVTSETGQEYLFTFPSPASVTAGTYYSVVLHEPENEGNGGKYSWAEYQPSDVYLKGHVWKSGDRGGSWVWGGSGLHDYYFRTYVSTVPPENIFDSITLYVWRGARI